MGAGDCMVRPGLAWRHRCVVSVVLVVLAKEKSFPILKSLCSVVFCCSCTHTIVYTHTHSNTHKRTHAHTRAPLSPLFLHTAFAIRLSLQEVNSEGDADADADVDVVNIAVFINVYCFCVILQ